MVSFINSWIKGIIIVVIITIIIEMILPEGKNKKYIKIVIGLYIMFVIISPIFSKITNKKIDVGKILEDYQIQETQINAIDNTQYIENIYKNNIKENIISNLKNMGYIVADMEVFINTEETRYGQIEKINLQIQEKSNIQKIEAVNIDKDNKQEESNIINEEDRKKMLTYLINNYGVSEKNIIIGVIDK